MTGSSLNGKKALIPNKEVGIFIALLIIFSIGLLSGSYYTFVYHEHSLFRLGLCFILLGASIFYILIIWHLLSILSKKKRN